MIVGVVSCLASGVPRNDMSSFGKGLEGWHQTLQRLRLTPSALLKKKTLPPADELW
jgi:hypothetical protein